MECVFEVIILHYRTYNFPQKFFNNRIEYCNSVGADITLEEKVLCVIHSFDSFYFPDGICHSRGEND